MKVSDDNLWRFFMVLLAIETTFTVDQIENLCYSLKGSQWNEVCHMSIKIVFFGSLEVVISVNSCRYLREYSPKRINQQCPSCNRITIYKIANEQYSYANWKSIDRLRASKASWKVRIPTTYNFEVVYPWSLLFS